MEPISIDDFKKVEIRVGEVLTADRIEGSDKLLKLRVNFGPASAEATTGEAGLGERQVLSGIAQYFPDEQVLVGKRFPFVTNLIPRKMMGLESEAMLMATGGGDQPLWLFETSALPGSLVK